MPIRPRTMALTVLATLLLLQSGPAGAPLRLFTVLWHEGGHAVAALVTGGRIVDLGLSPAGGGVTSWTGGWPAVIEAAGYPASLVPGLVLLLCALTGRRPRLALVGVGVATGAIPVVLRGTPYAVVVGLVLGGMLVVVGAAGGWGRRGKDGERDRGKNWRLPSLTAISMLTVAAQDVVEDFRAGSLAEGQGAALAAALLAALLLSLLLLRPSAGEERPA